MIYVKARASGNKEKKNSNKNTGVGEKSKTRKLYICKAETMISTTLKIK